MVDKADDQHYLQGCSDQSSSSWYFNDIKVDTKMVVIRSRAGVVLLSSSVGWASEYEILVHASGASSCNGLGIG
jgi:hypothetical protein